MKTKLVAARQVLRTLVSQSDAMALYESTLGRKLVDGMIKFHMTEYDK